jgi:hypothetical protein
MKYPLFALALFSCFTAIAAEPKLNTSSMADLEKSALRVIEWIKDSRDIGAQDKAFISNMIALRAVETERHILDEGGPNVTERQKDQICSKFLKKYNGLSVSQLHKVFLEEIKMEAEAKEKARAEEEAAREKMVQRANAEKAAAERKAIADKEAAKADQERKQKEKQEKQQTIFKDWLSGTPASLLELPDGTKIKSGFDLNRLTVHGFQLYIAPGTNPLESRHKVRTYTEKVPAGTLDRGLESLDDIFWWEPKFKDWANKMTQLPESERPEQYFKEIPKQGGNEKESVPTYFVYDKALGLGIWVGDGRSDLKAAKAALGSGNVLPFSKEQNDFMINPSQSLGGTFYDVKALYLASSSVKLFKSELQRLAGGNPEDQKASEKSKSTRDAVEKKLNLN